MFSELGETAYYQELLAFRGGIYFFVFQDPGIAVGNEDGVHPSGQRGVDIGLGTVADHPGAGVIAFVLAGELGVHRRVLFRHDFGCREVLFHSGTLDLS